MSVPVSAGEPPVGAPATSRTISVSDLLGHTVRDVDGRSIGRIEELTAEIELHGNESEYVVTSVSVGRYGHLDMIATGQFVPAMVRRWMAWTGYRRHEIPWDWLDLRDPAHPRLLRPASELPAG